MALLSATKERIEQLTNKLTILQSEGKYVEASKIKYVLIPELQKTLKSLEEKIDKGNRMVKEIVDAEQVASIVSK
jgi:CLP-like protein (fragment)